jgi:hypothetical protein
VDVIPVPNNHGPSAAVVADMTAAVIAETTRLHREATQVYSTYHNVYQAIKKLIIKSFDDTYLNALSDESMGYTNSTSLHLLTHLLTYYAIIAPTELTQNYERLNTLCDTNQPIEMLFANPRRSGLCGSGRPALWRRNDCQCCIHTCIYHGIVPLCILGKAIHPERLPETHGRSSS